MTAVAAARVVTPAGMTGPAVVELDGTRVGAVHPTAASVPDRTLVPGFVDLQVNGIDDVDVATATGSDWDRLDALLLAQGVTTWCPTLVTAPRHAYGPALARIDAAASRTGPRPHLAGVHLEGPFLGGAPGAHRRDLLAPVDLDWLAGLPGLVRIVTMAPELSGAVEAVGLLAGRGVLVSLGHSRADAAAVTAAVDAGARLVTHLFNGMAPFHHRDPGLVGVALTDDRLAVSLIADGVHVHPTAIALAFRAKGPDRVVLVTDAVALRAGRAGPLGIRLADGAPRLADSTLAGSVLTMDAAVRFVTERCGVPLERAVAAASTTPAALLGLHDRGAIAPGRRADLVALGPAGEVEAVWVAGEPVLEAAPDRRSG